jgi:hypothetical protein
MIFEITTIPLFYILPIYTNVSYSSATFQGNAESGNNLVPTKIFMVNPVAARSKVWVCSRLLAGIEGSNPAGAWKSVSCDLCAVR